MKLSALLRARLTTPARGRRPGLLLAGLLLAVALPGCKKKEDAAAVAPVAPTNAAPAAPPPPKEVPPTEFVAKWPVGKRLVLQTQTDADLSVTRPGAAEPVRLGNRHGAEHALSILGPREGGGLDMELEILAHRMDNRISTNLTTTNLMLALDTRSDPRGDRTNPAQQSFRKIIGSKLKVQTGADGKVTKLEGTPLLRSKLTAGASPQNALLFNQLFNDDALKSLLDLQSGLPDKPVKPGDTWELKRDLPGPGGVIFSASVTNTFKGMEEHDKRKCALFEQTGSLTNKPGTGPFGGVVTLESGSFTGKSWFDPELGLYVDSVVDTAVSMKTAFAALQGQSVATVVKQKTSHKVAEVTDAAPAAASMPAAPKAPGAK